MYIPVLTMYKASLKQTLGHEIVPTVSPQSQRVTNFIIQLLSKKSRIFYEPQLIEH